MKVRVITEKCQGHGRCYSLAPELFESDDYGNSVVARRRQRPRGARRVGEARRAQLPRAGGGHRVAPRLGHPVLFRQEHWAGLADGTITVAFRRWTKARAKAGRRARFPGGVLTIDDVRVVDASAITSADARRAGFANVAALRRELEQFGEGDTYRIALHFVGPDEREALRSDDDLTPEELATIRARLERLDRSSPRGPMDSNGARAHRRPARRARSRSRCIPRPRHGHVQTRCPQAEGARASPRA